MKGFTLHLVNFILNNRLPRETNVVRSCIMLIHKLRAEDQKGYYTFWWWTKTDLFLYEE
jgi:hypothetical protein